MVGRTKERIRRSARTAEHGARASKCVRVGHRDGAERDCFKDASPKMLLVRRAGRLLRLFVHLRLNVGRPNRYILTRYIKENSAIRSLPTTSKAQPTQRLCSPPAPHYNDLCINDPVMTRSEQHCNNNHMGWTKHIRSPRRASHPRSPAFSLIICPSIQEERGGGGCTYMT